MHAWVSYVFTGSMSAVTAFYRFEANGEWPRDAQDREACHVGTESVDIRGGSGTWLYCQRLCAAESDVDLLTFRTPSLGPSSLRGARGGGAPLRGSGREGLPLYQRNQS